MTGFRYSMRSGARIYVRLQGLLAAVMIVAGTMHVAAEAQAVVLVPLRLSNNKPVPANGVLTFSYHPDMTVRVVASDGTEIPGRFVREGIWRPDEPFGVGTYTADVSFEALPSLAEDRTFEVVEARALPRDFVHVRVTPRVDAAEVLEVACCEAGAAFVSGEPCSADCAPRCIPLAYAAEQKVEVAYGIDHDHLLSWQVEVSAPRETEDGEFRSGVWPVAGEPDELCGVAEVFSWLDETTSRVRYCVPNPKPELDPIRETVSSFGHITECTIPPTEYEEQWCFSQAYTCEQDVLTLPEVEKEDVAAACEHYRDVCDQRFPAEPPATHASTSSTAEPPPDPAEGTAAKSNSGCSTSGALICGCSGNTAGCS